MSDPPDMRIAFVKVLLSVVYSSLSQYPCQSSTFPAQKVFMSPRCNATLDATPGTLFRQCVLFAGHSGRHSFEKAQRDTTPDDETQAQMCERELTAWTLRIKSLSAPELLKRLTPEHTWRASWIACALRLAMGESLSKRYLCEAIWLIVDDILERRKDRMQGYAALRLLLGVDVSRDEDETKELSQDRHDWMMHHGPAPLDTKEKK